MCGAWRRRGFGLRLPARRAPTGRAEGLMTGRVRCEDGGMRGSFFLSVGAGWAGGGGDLETQWSRFKTHNVHAGWP